MVKTLKYLLFSKYNYSTRLVCSNFIQSVTIITLITIKCRSPKERSSRLPVGKKFSFIFCPWKGFRTHVSKIVQLFSNSLFLGRQKPKMIFGQYTRVDSDRKCKFHRFCPARSDCNNIAHAILSCYKLQGAFNQFNEKIWKLQQKYFSYNSSSFDLYLHVKIHQFVRKNS